MASTLRQHFLISMEDSTKLHCDGILIKNIYYMLTYAFQVLRKKDYERIESEPFEKIQDLYAEILYRGVSNQIKQGLYKEYVSVQDSLSSFKGKLDVSGTINNRIQHRQEVSCIFDELTENNVFNRIIKSSIGILLKDNSLDDARRKALQALYPYLAHIDGINLSAVHWSTLRFQRSNQTYEMLINICYFIYESVLLTTDSGTFKMMTFFDKQLSRLYERFVLEYYKTEFLGKLIVNADIIQWAINNEMESKGLLFMPQMRSDIMLKHANRTLIIDTKYYGRTLQYLYDKASISSHNLYQIFTYVNNEDMDNTGNVSGMLLYAKTQEEISPDMDFYVKKNHFLVKTLDLNLSFSLIKEQLNAIAYGAFPELQPRIGL